MTLPSNDEIRKFAYKLWKQRRGGDGFALADWLMAERMLIFAHYYEPVVTFPFVSRPHIHLGDPQTKSCRFCGNRPPRAKFSMKAHAVPEFLGNTSIFVHYECDSCNARLGRLLENHLGNLTNPIRVLMRQRGKKGRPTYKSPSGRSKIETKENVNEIKVGEDDNIVRISHQEKQVRFNLTTQPYIPLAVFKALTKIALMLMPESEFSHFAQAVPWVMNPNHAGPLPVNPAYCVFTFTPIPFFHEGGAALFRRRDQTMNVPYMMLVITARHLTFQVAVALSKMDAVLHGREVKFPAYPAGITMPYDMGEPDAHLLNLSSIVPETREFNPTLQVVGEIKKVPPPKSNDN